MGITEEQRQARRRKIGASDVGKIMGVNSFGGPKDVWASKVFDTDNSRMSRAAYRGVLLEPTVLKYAEEYEGVVPPGFVMSDNILFERKTQAGTPFAANCDAVVWTGLEEHVAEWDPDDRSKPRIITEVPLCVVEAKTSKYPHDWGKVGSDDIPDSYLFQVMVQMWCSGCTLAWVPVLLNDLEFRMYKVQYSASLMNIVIQTCDEFWWHVENGIEPSGPPPSLDNVREIVRDEESVIELEPEVEQQIWEWVRIKREKNELINREKELKSELILKLRDSVVGLVPGGYLSYTQDARGARTLRWNEEDYGQADT